MSVVKRCDSIVVEATAATEARREAACNSNYASFRCLGLSSLRLIRAPYWGSSSSSNKQEQEEEQQGQAGF